MRRTYRRRRLDQVVIAVEEILLPQIYAPQLTQAFLHESLYLYYREHLGFWITQVTDAITLAALPAWGAEHLACEAGDICGYIERIAKNQRGERVEFSRTWFDTRQACYMARWS